MFGWRLVAVNFNRRAKSLAALGFELRTFKDGSRWLELTLGRRTWTFAHYPRYMNRLTGPAENRAVLDHFYNGPERRVKGSDFRSGFAEAAAKPLPRHCVPTASDEGCGCPGCTDPNC